MPTKQINKCNYTQVNNIDNMREDLMLGAGND